jgi:hypothetical protein
MRIHFIHIYVFNFTLSSIITTLFTKNSMMCSLFISTTYHIICYNSDTNKLNSDYTMIYNTSNQPTQLISRYLLSWGVWEVYTMRSRVPHFDTLSLFNQVQLSILGGSSDYWSQYHQSFNLSLTSTYHSLALSKTPVIFSYQSHQENH